MKHNITKNSESFEQWALGDWEAIADATQNFYFQVASVFQLSTAEEAKVKWEELQCEEFNPLSLAKILMAGVHNNLGKAALILDDWKRAEKQYFFFRDYLEAKRDDVPLTNKESSEVSAKLGAKLYTMEAFPVTVKLDHERSLSVNLEIVSWSYIQLCQLFPNKSARKKPSIPKATEIKYNIRDAVFNLQDIKPKALSEKPVLTFSNDVSLYLESTYKEADVILEYGSGGSTVLAAQMPNKKIISVEDDLQWASNINHFLEENDFISRPNIFAVDIGETGRWAKPKDDKKWRNFPSYALSVWYSDNFPPPDVILIDGRFRISCFITAVLNVRKHTIVLFDDYYDRNYYHIVERLYMPTKKIGRMARFDITPKEWPREHLEWMVNSYTWVTYDK